MTTNFPTDADRDESRWSLGAIVDMETAAYSEDARRSAAGSMFVGSAYFVGPARNRVTDPSVNPAASQAWVAARDVAGKMSAAEADAYYGTLELQRNRVTPADAATRTDADALRDTRNHHQGSGIVHAADADHAAQMRRAGLIGPRGGLTRRGSIAAERLRNQALDDAFGTL